MNGAPARGVKCAINESGNRILSGDKNSVGVATRCGRRLYSGSARKQQQKKQQQPFDAYKGKAETEKGLAEEVAEIKGKQSVWEGKDYSYFFKIMNPDLCE